MTRQAASPGLRILVVEDDATHGEVIRDVLEQEGHEVALATSGREGMALLDAQPVDLVVTDLRLQDMDGLEIVGHCRELREGKAVPQAIVVTGYGTVEGAVNAMRDGALHYLQKPLDLGILRETIRAAQSRIALERQNRELQTAMDKSYSFPGIFGQTHAMQRVFDVMNQIMDTDATVLVGGESGTGKELVARALHYAGPRRAKAFIPLNCAALAEGVLESELFGHEVGAFTGATAQRKGRFEAADGGTVFLDEIGEMSQSLQAKLLRVLQENSFKRVGGVHDVSVDIRIIAATNRDLWEEVAASRFRKDLYFRLNVMPIRVPSLRERRQDIPELARHFLERFAESLRKPIRGMSEETDRMLADHPWPGNVRELRNVCEYAVIVCDGSLIEPRHLALSEIPEDAVVEASGIVLPLKDWSIRTMEEELIRMVLAETRFNITRAARELGINRSTLYNKMRDYGLSRDRGEIRQSV